MILAIISLTFILLLFVAELSITYSEYSEYKDNIELGKFSDLNNMNGEYDAKIIELKRELNIK